MHRPLDPQSRTFIGALAHVVTYLGSEIELFNSHVDSRALLEAAERRWDHHGNYSWQIPPSLAKKLTIELTGEPRADIMVDSSLLSGVEEHCLSHRPIIGLIGDAQENVTPSSSLLEGE